MNRLGNDKILAKVCTLRQHVSYVTSEANNLERHLSMIINRIEAIVNPNPVNTIKAVALPSQQEISERISQNIENLINWLHKIETLANTIYGECHRHSVTCDTCNGSGFVKEKVVSDDEFRVIEHQAIDCPMCGGTGQLNIDQDLAKSLSVMIWPLANIPRI